MRHPLLRVSFCLALLQTGCAANRPQSPPALAPPTVATPIALPSACSMAAASAWIERWLAAWELTSQEILRLPEAPAPEMLFYDGACIYTTSAVSAGGAQPVAGPLWRGAKLPWRALAHDGALTLPDGSRVPVALMSFTNATPETGPFFVMAAPAFWVENGHGEEPGLTGVFLHEFAHTRQVAGMGARIAPIDAAWEPPGELNDDAVQKRFADDPEYVAAYLGERDLLYRAAAAASLAEARSLAAEALASMRERRARWFTGESAMFAEVDDIFLAMEGVGQWAAYAWLARPEGGALDREAAIAKMLGRRKWWVQDEGLALLLAVDRLLPEWPALEFSVPALGAEPLLERAIAAR